MTARHEAAAATKKSSGLQVVGSVPRKTGGAVISIAGLPSTRAATRRSPSHSTVSGKWNSFGRTLVLPVAWPSVEAGGEPPPVAHRQRMLVAELAEEADGEGDQTLPSFALGGADRLEQQLEVRARGSSCSSASTTSGSSPDACELGDQPLGRGGPVSSSRNWATAAGGWAPTNSRTTSPSRNALTAGMPWIS